MTGVATVEAESLMRSWNLRGPAFRSEVIARSRLAPLQIRARRSRLVLVCAPAGYGKSTLVAQWTSADPRPSCRVQLGEGDNDPLVLLSGVLAALERAGGPVDSDLLAELDRSRPRISRVVLPLLAAELEVRDPLVMVLDDAHLITGERGQEILAFLVEQIRPSSQLFMVARGVPGIALSRLRASGDLLEIGQTDLRLDLQETGEVAESGGLSLSEEATAALHRRTEGWAAAVVLAALSFRDSEDADARAARLSGDQSQIADYLLEEVLSRQPEHLRRFLLGTSILERLTGPLCDAVLESTDSAAALESLARSNAFVAQIDDERRWYRYHPLFRDLLLAELERRHPETPAVYRRRAAQWCEQHGDPGLAFGYARSSGELAQAGRIALAHRDEFAMWGRGDSVRLWLERCSEEEIASDAQLSVAAAWVLAYVGDATRAMRFVAAAEAHPLDRPSADGASSLRSSLASLRTILAPDGIPQMLRDAELVYASETTAETRWRVSGARAMGVAYVLLGRPREAIAVLGEAVALLDDHPELAHVRIACLGYLTFAAADIGDRRNVQRWAVEASWLISEARLEDTIGSAIGHTAAALAHQQRGDYSEAARQLENVCRTRRHLSAIGWGDADLALRCADVSIELGDHAGALEFAEIATDALRRYSQLGTLGERLARLRDRITRAEDYGADLRRAARPQLPAHAPLAAGDRRPHLSGACDREEPCRVDLLEARRRGEVRGRRADRGARARGGAPHGGCAEPDPRQLNRRAAGAGGPSGRGIGGRPDAGGRAGAWRACGRRRPGAYPKALFPMITTMNASTNSLTIHEFAFIQSRTFGRNACAFLPSTRTRSAGSPSRSRTSSTNGTPATQGSC